MAADLYIYLFVSVYVYVYAYIHMYLYFYVCMCIFMFVYIHVCFWVCVCVCEYSCICICIHIVCKDVLQTVCETWKYIKMDLGFPVIVTLQLPPIIYIIGDDIHPPTRKQKQGKNKGIITGQTIRNNEREH